MSDIGEFLWDEYDHVNFKGDKVEMNYILRDKVTARVSQYGDLKNIVAYPEKADPDGHLISELYYHISMLEREQEAIAAWLEIGLMCNHVDVEGTESHSSCQSK